MTALSLYPEQKDLFAEYPELEEDIRQTLAFAASKRISIHFLGTGMYNRAAIVQEVITED